MDAPIFPWIDDDVAIEIIGKMIADQNRLLNSVLDAFENVGFDEDSQEVQANVDYQFHNQRIISLQNEISQIYRGEGKAELIEKVDVHYAPYIKGRLKALKSFGEFRKTDKGIKSTELINTVSTPSFFDGSTGSSQAMLKEFSAVNIAIFSTSSHENANSLRFVKYLKQILTEIGEYEVSIVTFEHYDIPYVGQGSVRKDNLTIFQQELISAWEAADLIIFALPEYNWTAPPQVFNTIHQLGIPTFKHLFNDKVFAIAGISSGHGSCQPALDITTVLNKIISFTNSYSIISPKLYESYETDKNLDVNGHFIGREIYEHTARAFVEYTLNIAQRWLKLILVEVK